MKLAASACAPGRSTLDSAAKLLPSYSFYRRRRLASALLQSLLVWSSGLVCRLLVARLDDCPVPLHDDHDDDSERHATEVTASL